MRVDRVVLADKLDQRVEVARRQVVSAPVNCQFERDAIKRLLMVSRLATRVRAGKGEWVGEEELVEHMSEVVLVSSPDIPWSRREAKSAARALVPLVAAYVETQGET